MADQPELSPAQCQSCGASLNGPYCASCGQRALPHRTLVALFVELAEGVLHADSKLWRTLPQLFINPGRLTRDWVDGRRSIHLSPLHLFLFAMFLLFLAMGVAHAHFTPLVDNTDQLGGEWSTIARRWVENPELSQFKIDAYAYKLAFLLAPMLMLATALVLILKKGASLYAHSVFALNEAAFVAFIALAALFVLPGEYAGAWIIPSVLGAFYIHATVHLRGAYRLSWFGAAVRGLMLSFLGLLIGVMFLYFAVFAALWL